MEIQESHGGVTATSTLDLVSDNGRPEGPQDASDKTEANRSDSCFPGSNQTHGGNSRHAKRQTAWKLLKNTKSSLPQLTRADKYKKLEDLYHGSFIRLSDKELRDLAARWTDDHAFEKILTERNAIIEYSINELISEARAGAEARESGQRPQLEAENGQHQEVVSDQTQLSEVESKQARIGQVVSEKVEIVQEVPEHNQGGSDMSEHAPYQGEVESSKVDIHGSASVGSASMEISDEEQGS